MPLYVLKAFKSRKTALLKYFKGNFKKFDQVLAINLEANPIIQFLFMIWFYLLWGCIHLGQVCWCGLLTWNVFFWARSRPKICVNFESLPVVIFLKHFCMRLIWSPSAVSAGCWIWSPPLWKLAVSRFEATSRLFWTVSESTDRVHRKERISLTEGVLTKLIIFTSKNCHGRRRPWFLMSSFNVGWGGWERGKSQRVGQLLPSRGPESMGICYHEQETGPPSKSGFFIFLVRGLINSCLYIVWI